MAYEMLTGAAAFQRRHPDVGGLPARPLRRAARLGGHAPGIPDALDDLIVAATRRDPAVQRPRDAAAFLSGAGRRSRARLGLRRVPVPVPHRQPVVPAGPFAAAAGAGTAVAGTAMAGTAVAGVPVAEPAGAGTGAQHGPGGTRVLAAGGPLTVAERSPATPPSDGAGGPPAAEPPVPARRPPRPPPTPEQPQRRRRQQRWAIAIVVIVVLGLLAAAGGWWLGGRWSSTPMSIGLTQAAAEAAVRDAGLVPRVTTEHLTTSRRAGSRGRRPRPAPTSLRGSEVELLVSSGRPQVPEIAAGTDPAAATAAIVAADLTVDPATTPRRSTTPSAGERSCAPNRPPAPSSGCGPR